MTEEVSIKLHDVFVMLNVDTIRNHVERVKRRQQIIQIIPACMILSHLNM